MANKNNNIITDKVNETDNNKQKKFRKILPRHGNNDALKVYTSDLCNAKHNQFNLNIHKHIKHKINLNIHFKCKKCNTIFKTRRSLAKHNSSYHKDKRNNNSADDTIKQSLSAKYKRLHKYNICYYCNYGFPKLNQLLNHITFKHLPNSKCNTFICNYCKKPFHTKKSCIRHEKTVHKIEYIIYFCGQCSTQENDVIDNGGEADNDNNNIPDKIGFISKEFLLQHIKCYHNEEYEENQNKTITNESNLLEKSKDLLKADINESQQNNMELINLNYHFDYSDIEWLDDMPDDFLNDDFDLEKDSHMVEEFLDEAFLDGGGCGGSGGGNDTTIIDNLFEKKNCNKCELCWKFFLTNEDLTLHDITEHTTKDVIKEEVHIKNINNSENTDGIIYIKKCNKKYVENTNITYCFKCPQCKEKFPSQFELNIHLADIHNKMVLQCNECGAAFNRNDELIKHRRDHQRENRISTSTLLSESITLPSESPSLTQTTNNTCKSISSGEEIETNIKLKSAPFCKLCDKDCSHNNNNIQCTFCTELFLTMQEMLLHRKSHMLNLYCSLCDKRFATISGLKYHLKTHTGIKAFKCQLCDKQFIANVNLNAHMRTAHSELKPYKCIECNLNFASNDHLRKHVNSIHKNLRNNVCNECGKRFLQKSHLTQHLWKHNGIKSHPCELCTNAYTSSSALKKHLLKTHSINQ